VGRRLVAELEELARRRGATRLLLARSDDVRGFLRARGWSDEGESLVRDL
jgi:hypothetical protein